MSADWDRVTALFGATRALDPADRTAFLDVACRTDLALRAEVEALLESDADDSFLEQPPDTAALSMLPNLLGPGRLLKDRYRIERPLSRGGQGLVYQATDEVLSRPVVVKVMRADARGNRWLKSRFEHEMEALSRISHPGVVGILDVGELADGSPFLVIEHIDGVSLRERLGESPLAAAGASDILRQLGAALSAAHAAGVAHHDLKPENVMIQRLSDGGGVVKLIDFGIAKIERSHLEAGATTVMVAGTIRYMAPEQFQGENSPACDVYALALVTCEMLSGQPDVRALPGRVRRRTRRLVSAALAFRPEERPADVRRWSDDVAQALIQDEGFRQRSALRLAAAALVVAASAFGARALSSYYFEPVRIIEKVAAFDPLREGFLAHNDVRGTVAYTPERDGFDGWRTVGTAAGNYYHRKLTTAQKRRAMKRGWTLSGMVRLEEGNAFVGVDFAGFGPRYDIGLYWAADQEIVRLETQIVPTFKGIELVEPRAQRAYHRYELRYDPSLETAELWIDGTKRLEQYRGHSQFQDDMGLIFGAAPFKSPRGVASFQSVRFEIRP
jgi:tRNA A-37 threonylcarbamoyl transferase component Bud32